MNDPLWAPWRLEYVSKADDQQGCIFCLAASTPDEQSLVVHRGELAFVCSTASPTRPVT